MSGAWFGRPGFYSAGLQRANNSGPMQNMALVHTGETAFAMTTLGLAAESIAGINSIAPGLQMNGACAIFFM